MIAPNIEYLGEPYYKNNGRIKGAFELYLSDIKNSPRLSIELEKELAEEIKQGTICAKLPSSADVVTKRLAPNHLQIYNPPSKLVDALYSFQIFLNEMDILDRKNHLYENSVVSVKAKNGYCIDSTYGFKKVRLFFRTSQAQAAKQYFILANLPLVIHLAKKYNRQIGNWLHLEDLVDVGNDLLLQIIDYFNPDIRKFSTFFAHSLWKEFYNLGKSDRNNYFSLGDIEQRLEDTNVPDIDHRLIALEREQAVAELIPGLESRERIVIKMRYWDGKRFKEIGQAINIGKERARQIEKEAIGKLTASIEPRKAVFLDIL